jgi:hypothetical protein
MFYFSGMDWDFSTERNRALLLPVVAGLFAKIGLSEGGAVERVSRPLYRKVLSLLRPAEAAVRRLIIVMARNIVVEPRPKRPMPSGLARSRKGTFQGKSSGKDNGQSQETKPRKPSFNLFDPERRADFGQARRRRRKGRKVEPHVHVILPSNPHVPWFLRGQSASTPPPAVPRKVEAVTDGTVSAKRLCRRLFAIMYALTNMEREAERYARLFAKPVEERRPQRERALRFGRPPGWRNKPTHEVHEILKECHWLFHELPKPAPDTS